MANWFECKVKYGKTLETGIQKTVTESFLVDALSFTEAEGRIIEEVRPFVSGEFTVSAIKRANYSEVYFDATGDRWFRCRVSFITIDEKTGVEKLTPTNILVQATEHSQAVENLNLCMKGTMADWRITAVNETSLQDVFRYESNVPDMPKE
jgi:hypothetical protein